ncbi:DNA repair protein RecO, partial [Enterococcus cecorum]|nr:DNA repair protein RecO [Enterococcus cecorum]
EYVGIHLKSKKFIDQMKNWQDILIKPETNSATESNE